MFQIGVPHANLSVQAEPRRPSSCPLARAALDRRDAVTGQRRRSHSDALPGVARVGERWRVRVTDPLGKSHHVGMFDTVAEANRAKLAEGEAAKMPGWVPPSQRHRAGRARLREAYAQGQVTVGAWVRRCLDRWHHLAPKTRQQYAALLRNWVCADVVTAAGPLNVGARPLSALTAEEAELWAGGVKNAVARRSGANNGETTAAQAWRLLRQCYRTAVSDGLVPPDRNPVASAKHGTVAHPERAVATVDQVAQAALAMPPRWALAPYLCCWGFARKGEALGLQRQDIAMHRDSSGITGAQVSYRRQVSDPNDGLGPRLAPLKTAGSRRSVEVPARIARLLDDHLTRYTGPEPDAQLFTSAGGGLVDISNFNRAWRKARETAGCRGLTIHDLRHTGLTMARRKGASLPDLMRLAGHSTLQSVSRYQHVDSGDLQLIATAMDLALDVPAVAATAERLRSPLTSGGTR